MEGAYVAALVGLPSELGLPVSPTLDIITSPLKTWECEVPSWGGPSVKEACRKGGSSGVQPGELRVGDV